jgi:hypothetical protein
LSSFSRTSYEVNIFFGEKTDETLAEVAGYLVNLFGAGMNQNDTGFETRLLALEFDLSNRASFLTDMKEMPFSVFKFQLGITARVSSMTIIHPVALMISEILSKNFRGRVMLCLSTLEYLGAIYENGELAVDRMGEHPELYAGTSWAYNK